MNVTLDLVLEYLRTELDRFRRDYGVTRIGVFGSLVRNEQTDASDIDVLVEMPKPTFHGYFDLKFELERYFGRNVDLILSHTIKRQLRPFIESEVVYV